MVIEGDVTFTGNGTNTNTTVIAALTDVGLSGVVALNGVRTFNIGDGAADEDLSIEPGLVDGASPGGLTKTGAGTLALSGSSTYTGATIVQAGVLLLHGAVSGTSGVTVESGAHLGGNGSVSATIGGAGAVNPGSSPGVFTAPQIDPSLGLDFNFELTLANATPTWAATENDLLRLTDSTDPFTSSLGAGNVMNLFLGIESLEYGDVFTGGFYTDGGDFLADISTGSIVGWIEDAGGALEYEGKFYSLITGGIFEVSTVADTEFSGTGHVTQFTYAVPETSHALLILVGLSALWLPRRRVRQ